MAPSALPLMQAAGRWGSQDRQDQLHDLRQPRPQGRCHGPSRPRQQDRLATGPALASLPGQACRAGYYVFVGKLLHSKGSASKTRSTCSTCWSMTANIWSGCLITTAFAGSEALCPASDLGDATHKVVSDGSGWRATIATALPHGLRRSKTCPASRRSRGLCLKTRPPSYGFASNRRPTSSAKPNAAVPRPTCRLELRHAIHYADRRPVGTALDNAVRIKHKTSPSLKMLQMIIDGYIKTVPHLTSIKINGKRVRCTVYCNENARLKACNATIA